MLHQTREGFAKLDGSPEGQGLGQIPETTQPDLGILPSETVPSSLPMNLDICGTTVAINCASFQEFMTRLQTRLLAGTGFAVATINLDHLVKLRENSAFRVAYQAHDLIVADGNPITWMSRVAKRPVALLPGSELIFPVCKLAAALQVPVALVGSTAETLQKASAVLQHRYPELTIAARIAPDMGFDPDSDDALALLDQLRDSDARLCLLALGAPKQERLAALGRSRTPDMGFVSVGAGLDFIAGRQRRAPRFVRALALEWLWRLLGNPGRLGLRYAKCAAIFPGFLLQASRLRAQRPVEDAMGNDQVNKDKTGADYSSRT